MSVEVKAAVAPLREYDLPGLGAAPPVIPAPPFLNERVPPPPAPRQEWPRVGQAGRLLLVALILGGAFDALCGSGWLGIGFPIFVCSLLGATLSLGVREGVLPRWQNAAFLGVPLVFFAIMVAVRANGFLTFGNVAATIVLFPLFLHYQRAGRIEEITFLRFFGLPWGVSGRSLVYAAPTLSVALSPGEKRQAAQARVFPILRGLLFALPALAIFLALFASADNIFARLLSNAGAWLLPSNIGDRIFHLCLALGAAWLIAGGLVYALTRREDNVSSYNASRRPPLGFVETLTVLISVSLLFSAFIVIQFLYLFGDMNHVMQSFGLNYATYARHGFGELVTVAALTLALIYNLQTVTRRENGRQIRAFNLVGTLLIGLTLILLVSAARRMQLYEAAYGATELRFYVDHFLVWLGAALCWFVVTLWRVPGRFPLGAFACGVGFLAVLNLVDPDDVIVRHNVARYAQTKILDTEALTDLSDDALPALCAALDHLPEGDIKTRLAANLRDKQYGGKNHYEWQEAHWARYRAQQALARCCKAPISKTKEKAHPQE